jgi:KamA family protein
MEPYSESEGGKVERRHPPMLDWLADKANTTPKVIEAVAREFPARISSFLRKRVEDGTYSMAAARQYLPDARELLFKPGWTVDPCNERNYQESAAVIRKYPNRAAVILTHKCIVYCRYCFRKDFVGKEGNDIQEAEWRDALEIVRRDSTINDILLSGGDPLVLPNSRLIPVLTEFAQIPHLHTIRIHSRALSVAPRRFDEPLLAFLEEHSKFWYYAHMNHPDDVDHPLVRNTVRKLLGVGVPVLNQSVILSGVNDDPETMAALFTRCYESKVVPYNLYALDRVHGASHFMVPNERIADIVVRLSQLPGPAQPTLVVVDRENLKRRLNCDTPRDQIITWLAAFTEDAQERMASCSLRGR